MSLKNVDITVLEGRKIGSGNFFAEVKSNRESGINLVQATNDKEAAVEFRYSANYGGMVATKIEGNLAYEGDAKAIVKSWNETTALPQDAQAEIQSAIMALCSIESDVIFKDIMFPPMNLPLPEGSPIRGFEITCIEGKRFTRQGEKFVQVRIDHNSTVTQITELTDKEASLEFRFTANYVGVGVIKTEGKMIYTCDAPSVVKHWATQHNMPESMANDIHTGILHFGIPEAVLIARELKLPPPIPLPQVTMQKKPTTPPKSGGQEVA